MKVNIKDIVVNLLVLLLAIYLPFAFIVNEFNPLAWGFITRSLYVLGVVALITYAVNDYNKK